MNEAKTGLEVTVDLEHQTIIRSTHNNGNEPGSTSNEDMIHFEVDGFRKHCLLNGLDDIGLTLQKVSLIDSFEQSRSDQYPWLDGPHYKPG